MEEHLIRETLTYTTRQITEADKVVASEFNRGVLEAIALSRRYMKHGPESARLAVVQTYLRSAAKLSTVDAKAEVEASRMIFLEELSKMTEITAAEPQVTPTGVIEARTHAPLPDPVYRESVDQDYSP